MVGWARPGPAKIQLFRKVVTIAAQLMIWRSEGSPESVKTV